MVNYPEITGKEKEIQEISRLKKDDYASVSNINSDKVISTFGIALHMHQPTILSDSPDLKNADLINNIQYMLDHPDIGDNHNASVFLSCYSRMSNFIRDLVSEGKNPRVMLDYSGNLFWGLEQLKDRKVLDNLKLITCDSNYYRYVEWLGTMWSHSVVPSTPIPDIKLHILAWQQHFSSIFGIEALKRVKGFSPPEMHLPIHPDTCYEYVKALKECGYEWVMVQEHTIENLDGTGIRNPYIPHKLTAKNSLGDVETIAVLIKTQGSDTKLVGQMQPYYEAKSKHREDFCGRTIPPFVLQISDGENGGVIMNEFPPKYNSVYSEITTEGVVGMNGSEYLEFIKKIGIELKDFIPVQPVSQNKVWKFFDKFCPGAADKAIEKAKDEYPGFNLDKASWTSDKNWVHGYQDVLDPINKLSAEFHERFDKDEVNTTDSVYREALLYLLLSQTSCFRYWGSGIWTDYAKEICRRGEAIIKS